MVTKTGGLVSPACDVGPSASVQSGHWRAPRSSLWDSLGGHTHSKAVTHFDQIIESGIELPQPDQLEDKPLSATLWRVIYWLSRARVFLEHTDHLSDRQLYELLWYDLLRRETWDTRQFPHTCCRLDLLGSGTDEDQYLFLRYYADSKRRRFWREQFPDATIPEHEEPPFPRDKILPGRDY
jgi:hypothetical protein